MRETQPRVRLICQPAIDWTEIRKYLDEIGGRDWAGRMPANGSDGDGLVEFAGRLCYRSWAPGLNANVRKVREDSREYVGHLLASRHGSVLEHANYTFVFQDVSRVFTHELVRHRAGAAVSQESLRFVRLTEFGFRIPPRLLPLAHKVRALVEHLEQFQIDAAALFGLDVAGVSFDAKKQMTSALRRLAPLGLSTSLVWTANVRALRHTIEQRTDPGAEEEIRFVFDEVARIMQRECPLLFGDYARQEDGSWATPHRKV